MIDIFNKIFELIKEAKGGSSWLFVLLAATFVDTYVIACFDRSLADFITAPQTFLVTIQGRELAEISLFVIMFVVTWFYLIPGVCVPFWRWLVIYVSSKIKITQFNWPTVERGFIPLGWAERRAITQDNSLLFQLCVQRREAAHRRDSLLAYMLGIIIFSSVAWIISPPESTCLLYLLEQFFSSRNKFLQMLICIASLPAIGITMHVLFYNVSDDDDYMYLPELADEYRQRN